jgi:dCMP deaminase
VTHDKAHKYLDLAYATAKLSKDNRTTVVALVLGPAGEVRSLGYNGAPRGSKADEDKRSTSRPEKYFWFSHAEANAITNAARVGTPLENSVLICTHFPCMDCARLIVQAGIKSVWVPKWEKGFDERWKEHICRANDLFNECGIEVHLL